MKARSRMDAGLAQSSVQTAYEELRYARVRTYLPVLMERRAKDLAATESTTLRESSSATSPKIVRLKFSQVVGATVMKNCEPFVLGPMFAMDKPGGWRVGAGPGRQKGRPAGAVWMQVPHFHTASSGPRAGAQRRLSRAPAAGLRPYCVA